MHENTATGANGFIGSNLIRVMHNNDFKISAAYRSKPKERKDLNLNSFIIGDIDADTDWSNALNRQEVVIHTAAITNIISKDIQNTLKEYRKVNVDGTLNLARQAFNAGVKKVYIYQFNKG